MRRQWDQHAAARAVIGKLNQRIAGPPRTLSNLYSSGVPIVATLIASRDAVGNRWIISQFDEVLDKVRAGNSLSESLALVDGFEKSMSLLHRRGRGDRQAGRAAGHHQRDAGLEAEVATTAGNAAEPIMIVIMGIGRSLWSPSSCPSTSPTVRWAVGVRRAGINV